MGLSLERPNGNTNTVNDQIAKQDITTVPCQRKQIVSDQRKKKKPCKPCRGAERNLGGLPTRAVDNENRAHCDWFRGTEVDIGQCGNTSMNISLHRTPSVCTWGPFYSKCSSQRGGRKRLQTEEQQLHVCGETDAEPPSGSARSVDCEADGPEELAYGATQHH